jgi:hypothetical protein
VPEADRVEGMVTFACIEPLYTTRSSDTAPGTSDKLEWHGELYKIIQLLDYLDYGFNVAVGVRLSGE